MTEQLRASSHARVMCVGDDCICVVVCGKVLFSCCGRGTQRKDMDWFELMVQGNNDTVEQLVQQGTVGPWTPCFGGKPRRNGRWKEGTGRWPEDLQRLVR